MNVFTVFLTSLSVKVNYCFRVCMLGGSLRREFLLCICKLVAPGDQVQSQLHVVLEVARSVVVQLISEPLLFVLPKIESIIFKAVQ